MLLWPKFNTLKTIKPMGSLVLSVSPRTYSCKFTPNNVCSKSSNPCDAENIRKMKCEFKKIRKMDMPNLCDGGCETCPKLGDACDVPKKEYEKPRKSMWYNPKCCNEVCPGMVPRYDQLYYKPQGLMRCFVRTWAECPRAHIAPRKVCCFNQMQLPPIERRPRKPKSDKIFTAMDKLLLMCRMKSHDKCYKLQLPNCRPVRNPPKCYVIRRPSNCQKPKTPYPSYSECDKPKPKPLRQTECACLVVNTMCKF